MPTLAPLLLFAALTLPPSSLSCHLEAVPPLTAGGPVKIRFTLGNRTRAPLWVLRWNTPLEERWRGTIFTVTAGGKELTYQGPMTKRGDPAREEYAEIPAGGSVTGEADLSQVYEMTKPGRYQVKVTGELADVVSEGSAVPRLRDGQRGVKVQCGTVGLDVGASSEH